MKEVSWVMGKGNWYVPEEVESAIMLSRLHLEEIVGNYYIYSMLDGNRKGRLLASFYNQKEIRDFIEKNKYSTLGIKLLKPCALAFSYEVKTNKFGKVHVPTIAGVAVIIPGTKEYPRSISADPAGIVVR